MLTISRCVPSKFLPGAIHIRVYRRCSSDTSVVSSVKVVRVSVS
jgi:hypothetical protein